MSETPSTSRTKTVGGIAALHLPLPQADVSVAPTLVSSEHNTLKNTIVPFACWRASDIRFDFESSFVRPEITVEIASLNELVEKHTIVDEQTGAAHKPALSIFGHADPTGDDEFNKLLAGRRSQAIYAMLTRRVDLWEDLFSNPLGNDKWDPGAIKSMQTTLGQPQSSTVSRTTRQTLFKQYMDHICTVRTDDGQPALDETGQPKRLELLKTDFLGNGSDDKGKADYQGCGEFNPSLVFSREENDRFSNSKDKSERNSENTPNRRVVIFVFRPGVRVDPGSWPCPRAKEGTAACRKRFWSNGDDRRNKHLPDERRHFEISEDTFACRFYHRFADRSPCERVIFGDGWIIRIDKKQELAPDDTVTLVSEQARYKATVSTRNATDTGDFLDFLFPEGPKAKYDVFLTVAGKSYFAWKELALPGDGQGVKASSIQYAAEQDIPNPYPTRLAGRESGQQIIFQRCT